LSEKDKKRIVRQLEKVKNNLAKERDCLRDLQSEIEEYEDLASDAHDAIEQAVERLSEYL
jgi:uncharacterized protein YlxW (UPF0749 family)